MPAKNWTIFLQFCGLINLCSRSLTVYKAVGRKAKFPLIDDNYQVSEHENMYVAGTAAHSLDYRRAAGGFIHGFRYTGESHADSHVSYLQKMMTFLGHGG